MPLLYHILFLVSRAPRAIETIFNPFPKGLTDAHAWCEIFIASRVPAEILQLDHIQRAGA